MPSKWLSPYVRRDGRISWRYKFHIHRQTFQGTLGPIPEKEAVKRVGQLYADAERGIYFPTKTHAAKPPPTPTLEQIADAWLDSYKIDARRSTTNRHISRLTCHLVRAFPGPITDVTTAAVDAYRALRGRQRAAVGTINGELSTLSIVLRKAVEWGYLPLTQKPVITWLRREASRMRVLSPEEEAALLLAAPPRLQALITFALHTGLRRQELTTLQWRQIDFAHRVVTITSEPGHKTRRERQVPLDETALGILRGVPLPHLPLARIFGYHSVNSSFTRVSRKAGLSRVTPHTLRHTWATRCIEAWIPTHVVQQWLGHHSVTMTERYVHISPRYQHDLIRALDPDNRPTKHPAALSTE